MFWKKINWTQKEQCLLCFAHTKAKLKTAKYAVVYHHKNTLHDRASLNQNPGDATGLKRLIAPTDTSNITKNWLLSFAASFAQEVGTCTGWRKKGQWAILSNCKYSENSMTEFRELLQNYMLNTVINFLFSSVIVSVGATSPFDSVASPGFWSREARSWIVFYDDKHQHILQPWALGLV